MRKNSREILNAFSAGKKKTSGNVSTDGESIFLFGNKIARRVPGGFEISNAGYFTATTKEKLNSLPGVSLSQKAGKWYLNGEIWDGKWTKIEDSSFAGFGSIPTPVKWGLIGTAVAVVTGLGIWTFKKKTFADGLVVTQSISVQVLEKKNFIIAMVPWVVQLVVVPHIKNPSNVKATIIQPYVEIKLFETDKAPFATSQVSNAEIKIDKLSEVIFNGVGTNPKPILIKVNIGDLASKAGSIIQAAIKAKSLSVLVNTKTFLVTAAGKLPVTQSDKVNIKL